MSASGTAGIGCGPGQRPTVPGSLSPTQEIRLGPTANTGPGNVPPANSRTRELTRPPRAPPRRRVAAPSPPRPRASPSPVPPMPPPPPRGREPAGEVRTADREAPGNRADGPVARVRPAAQRVIIQQPTGSFLRRPSGLTAGVISRVGPEMCEPRAEGLPRLPRPSGQPALRPTALRGCPAGCPCAPAPAPSRPPRTTAGRRRRSTARPSPRSADPAGAAAGRRRRSGSSLCR